MEKKLVVDRDIVMLGIQPWDIDIGCNFKDMALEISKNYRVLYVNRPLDRFTSLTKKSDIKTKNRLRSIRMGEGVINQVNSNLWEFNARVIVESINWLPPGGIYNYLNQRNNKLLASEIKYATRILAFKKPILLIDNDFFNGVYLNDYLEYDLVMYYLRDYLLSQPYFSRHGRYAEPYILKHVDLVTTNSQYLKEYAYRYNKRSAYIGQGCDVQEFAEVPLSVPADMVHIKKPIIGYCGSLNSLRLDLDLLKHIAEAGSEWSLVFVGPEDSIFRNSELHSLKNVHFLGYKDPEMLAAYIHGFDVCINPQLVNDLTIGNYPRKVDEYLAAGRPVVATRTRAMEEFSDVVYLCDSVDEYVAAIWKAISESGVEALVRERKKVAGQHTWESSVQRMYKAINDVFRARV